jgi:SAM-dependent methyltransferase
VPQLRSTLDRLRGRFPTAYWRARNAFALAELYALRLRGSRRRADAYDEGFWDAHASGDWDGFARVVLGHVAARSIADVGCGQGIALGGFASHDPTLQLRGYDYSPAALRRGRERGLSIERVDLIRLSSARAAELARELAAVDLVLCLEVAEHLPAWRSSRLLTVLGSARALVFSAAHPNQGGHLHVNEQPAVYWIDRLAARGLIRAPSDEAFRRDVAALDLPWWYARNIHLFVRSPPAACTSR